MNKYRSTIEKQIRGFRSTISNSEESVSIYLVGLGMFLVLVMCLLAYILLIIPSFRLCIDPFGGRVPIQAQEGFIQRIIERTLDEDFDWLLTVSQPHAVERLMELKPKMTPNYNIVNSDDLGGLYEYYVQFDNGTRVYLAIHGVWHKCPDFDVTEQDMIQNLELIRVKESRFPSPTPLNDLKETQDHHSNE